MVERASQPRPASGIAILDISDFAIVVAMMVAGILFKIVSMPRHDLPAYAFIITPEITKTVHNLLGSNWLRFLLPYRYEPGRYYWSTSAILFTYAAQVLVGPVFSYLFFSSLLVTTTFLTARLLRCSRILAATLAFMFAFGTQLDYLFTYGNLIALYLVLTYIAVNFGIALRLVTGDQPSRGWHLAFVSTLLIVALSNEMWLNYATALLTAALFGTAWAQRHSLIHQFRACRFILAATLAVLVGYLLVRMRFVSEYLAPGAEEELLVTYHSIFLLVDDLVANFVTLLYTVLSNYLPSFVSSSNSLTYLPNAYILAEQHGYDVPHQELILMSHLFLWRFYAGIEVTLFVGFLLWAVVNAWRSSSQHWALLAALGIMVITSFSTHLAIKMRPYNAVPALPYKAIVSVAAFTVLIAYIVDLSMQRLKRPWVRKALVASVWCCVLLAALTRPLMQSRLLDEVGLIGAGDPLGQILRWLQ